MTQLHNPKQPQPEQHALDKPELPRPESAAIAADNLTESPPPPLKRKRRWGRNIAYGIGGVGVVALGVLAFLPKPIAVDMADVEQGSLQVTVDAEGKTRVRDRFTISAPVAGRLQRLELDEGDRVEAEQVIAQIDPLPLTAQVRSVQSQIAEMEAERAGVETLRPKSAAIAQAEAQIEAARAARDEAKAKVLESEAMWVQAQRDRQRAEELRQSGAIAQQSLESAQLDEDTRKRQFEAVKQAATQAEQTLAAAVNALKQLQAEQSDPDYQIDAYNARIRSLESQLVRLADDARRTEIRVAQPGEVLRVHEESARFVQAGTPLLEVGNPGQLELVVDVLSSDAVQIQPGANVLIDQWGGEQPLIGTVRYVEPSAFTETSALGVEEQRVNVIVDLTNPPANLGDGFRVEAHIVVWEQAKVTKVPVSALFRCESAWCVFVTEDGTAQRRQIKISQRNQSEAAVQKGLKAGETVILHPSEAIDSGVLVTTR